MLMIATAHSGEDLRTAPAAHPGAAEAETVAALKAELAATRKKLREQEAYLRESRRLIGGALAAAQAGVWRCRLSDERLSWTGGVYDLFEIRPGAPLRRQHILECYEPRSRAALEEARSRAIRNGGGFALDAEIVTQKGRSRWIRLSATVVPGSGGAAELFGLKQDITEAKTAAERARRLAEIDAVTGLANRALFETRLGALCAGARAGALLLIDLDGFKGVNDTFGHAIGDECLREAAARLRTVCRGAELVARIGGDEFAALIGDGVGRAETERLAGAIVQALGAPVERGAGRICFGASVGAAFAGGRTPSELFMQADVALYAAKAAGRGAFRIFDSATMRPEAPLRP